MPSWKYHRARVAALSRDRAPDDPELATARRDFADARRDLREERLAAAIRKAVDAAPPLSDEQRTRLAALLHALAGGTR